MRVFLDTNILAYRLDVDEPEKQQRAADALDTSHELVVSTQVLIELFSVLTRRFGLTKTMAHEVIEAIDYPTVPADRDLVLRAARLADEHQLSIFDAMVVAAAAHAGCDELWTEDLSHEQQLLGVRIVNPLRD